MEIKQSQSGAHEEGNGLVVDSFDKWRYEHYFGFSA